MSTAAVKVYAVVGGTAGIGAAVSRALNGPHAHVIVAGRSAKNPAHALDVTSMRQCVRLAREIEADPHVAKHGLSGLVLSAGNLNLGLSRVETDEGVEKTFALNYLSKFALINHLLPSLERAKDARVVSIMAGGNGGKFDVDDLQMAKGSYNCISQAIGTGAMIDSMTYHLASRNQTPTSPKFFHLFPGVVNTDNPKNAGFPSIIVSLMKIVMPLIARDPNTVAAEVIELLTSEKYTDVATKSGLFLHPGLGVVPPYKSVLDVAQRERVWNESERILKEALAKSETTAQ
ncbi:hypothetical protein HDU81_003132 [Chytriomyces hyalinus]|nr:hypothetical protein HDU81_003132 [Chytriomyces hyalinus]